LRKARTLNGMESNDEILPDRFKENEAGTALGGVDQPGAMIVNVTPQADPAKGNP